MNDFEKDADIIMDLYRKTGLLEGLSDKEIEEMRQVEVERGRRIRKSLEELEKQKNKNT